MKINHGSDYMNEKQNIISNIYYLCIKNKYNIDKWNCYYGFKTNREADDYVYKNFNKNDNIARVIRTKSIYPKFIQKLYVMWKLDKYNFYMI